jgi:hypothetical protein
VPVSLFVLAKHTDTHKAGVAIQINRLQIQIPYAGVGARNEFPQYLPLSGHQGAQALVLVGEVQNIVV